MLFDEFNLLYVMSLKRMDFLSPFFFQFLEQKWKFYALNIRLAEIRKEITLAFF